MNCPHCGVHIDEHPASRCFDLWILKALFGWKKTKHDCNGDFWPKGSYHIVWLPPEGYDTITQAFDKNGNILSADEKNPFGIELEFGEFPTFSEVTTDAKKASDKAGATVIFAPHSSVKDGSYANRKKEWRVEIIPHGGTTKNAVCAYGKTEEIARCRAAIKVKGDSR